MFTGLVGIYNHPQSHKNNAAKLYIPFRDRFVSYVQNTHLLVDKKIPLKTVR